MTNKSSKGSIVLYVVLVAALLVGMVFMLNRFSSTQVEQKKYSEVVGYFQDNKVFAGSRQRTAAVSAER